MIPQQVLRLIPCEDHVPQERNSLVNVKTQEAPPPLEAGDSKYEAHFHVLNTATLHS
jgi:hypothetical protein